MLNGDECREFNHHKSMGRLKANFMLPNENDLEKLLSEEDLFAGKIKGSTNLMQKQTNLPEEL